VINFIFSLTKGSVSAQDEETYEYVDTVQYLRDLQASRVVAPYEPNSTVCFDYEGCFTNEGPWANTGNYLPMHPDDLGTEFVLFTRQAQDLASAKILNVKQATSLQGTGFDPALPLNFVIHGFSNDRNTDWVVNLVKTLLAKVKLIN
jgi:hypothetical protein